MNPEMMTWAAYAVIAVLLWGYAAWLLVARWRARPHQQG